MLEEIEEAVDLAVGIDPDGLEDLVDEDELQRGHLFRNVLFPRGGGG